jgi:hypothetical protein
MVEKSCKGDDTCDRLEEQERRKMHASAPRIWDKLNYIWQGAPYQDSTVIYNY